MPRARDAGVTISVLTIANTATGVCTINSLILGGGLFSGWYVFLSHISIAGIHALSSRIS